MKATLPFNPQFRIDLEKYETIIEGNSTLTEDDQFNALYNSTFINIVGEVYWNANNSLYGSGLQGDMARQVENKIKIKDMKGLIKDSSVILKEYMELPARPFKESEIDIIVSDLNEWFRASNFPLFTATKYFISPGEDILFPEGGWTFKWVNLS